MSIINTLLSYRRIINIFLNNFVINLITTKIRILFILKRKNHVLRLFTNNTPNINLNTKCMNKFLQAIKK